jgi:hypothetical protein
MSLLNEIIKNDNVEELKKYVRSLKNTDEEEKFYECNTNIISALMNGCKNSFSYLITLNSFDLTDYNNDLFSDCVGYYCETGDSFFYLKLLEKRVVVDTVETKGYEDDPDVIVHINYFKNKDKILNF